jgi:drug/metabolite transporter (DMT)-like permease
MEKLSPLAAVSYACLIGAVALFVPAAAEGMAERFLTYSPSAWLGIVYLGFFGSALGFFWYYEGIKAIGPARAGVFINIVPVSAVVLAFLFLNETLDGSLVLGAVFVLTGVTLTNRVPSSSRGKSPVPVNPR